MDVRSSRYFKPALVAFLLLGFIIFVLIFQASSTKVDNTVGIDPKKRKVEPEEAKPRVKMTEGKAGSVFKSLIYCIDEASTRNFDAKIAEYSREFPGFDIKQVKNPRGKNVLDGFIEHLQERNETRATPMGGKSKQLRKKPVPLIEMDQYEEIIGHLLSLGVRPSMASVGTVFKCKQGSTAVRLVSSMIEAMAKKPTPKDMKMLFANANNQIQLDWPRAFYMVKQIYLIPELKWEGPAETDTIWWVLRNMKKSPQPSMMVLKALLENGASPTAKSKDGEDPVVFLQKLNLLEVDEIIKEMLRHDKEGLILKDLPEDHHLRSLEVGVDAELSELCRQVIMGQENGIKKIEITSEFLDPLSYAFARVSGLQLLDDASTKQILSLLEADYAPSPIHLELAIAGCYLPLVKAVASRMEVTCEQAKRVCERKMGDSEQIAMYLLDVIPKLRQDVYFWRTAIYNDFSPALIDKIFPPEEKLPRDVLSFADSMNYKIRDYLKSRPKL